MTTENFVTEPDSVTEPDPFAVATELPPPTFTRWLPPGDMITRQYYVAAVIGQHIDQVSEDMVWSYALGSLCVDHYRTAFGECECALKRWPNRNETDKTEDPPASWELGELE